MLYLDFGPAKTKDENRERLTEFSVGPKPAMQNATVPKFISNFYLVFD